MPPLPVVVTAENTSDTVLPAMISGYKTTPCSDTASLMSLVFLYRESSSRQRHIIHEKIVKGGDKDVCYLHCHGMLSGISENMGVV